MTDESTGGGLHIDGDWKEEAAREKQRLAAEEAKNNEAPKDQKADAGFIELLNLLGMHAAIALGGAQGPGGEPIPPNPESAKFHIDMLEVLKKKTEGNLSDEEDKTLSAVLFELQQQYVRAMTAAAPPPAGTTSPQ